MNPSATPLGVRAEEAAPEPPPRVLPPMEPVEGDPPRTGDRRWAYQPRFSGQRVTVHLHGAPTALNVWPALRLVAPDGLDLTSRFPEFAPLAVDRPRRPRILDGIIIVTADITRGARTSEETTIDLRGPRPTREVQVANPGGLEYRLAASGAADAANRALALRARLLLVDIVHVAGRRVGDLPYVTRRSLIDTEVADSPDGRLWQIPPDHLDVGEALSDAIASWGVTSLIAKRLDGRYFPGLRSPGWSRLDFPYRDQLVVAGWLRAPRGGHLDGLVLARPEPDGTLRWAGIATQGLTLSLRTDLGRHLGRLVTDRPTLTARPDRRSMPRRLRWLKPDLQVDVAARDARDDGVLEGIVLLGLTLRPPDDPN